MKLTLRKKSPGYALVLAMLMIGVITMLIAGIVPKVMVFTRLGSVLMDREQARMLALSGMQIAIAQLSDEPQPETTKDEKQKESEVYRALKRVQPIINRWQTFTFTQEKEGIDGSCELYIAAEQGKINVNLLYDFGQKKFVKDAKVDGYKILQLASEKLPQGKELPEIFSTLFKERGRPLQDVTEIFNDKKLKKKTPAVFLNPKISMALLDLFTVETKKPLVQPLFLSKSLQEVLGLKTQEKFDKNTLDTILEKVKSAPKTIPWQQNWDTYLAPIYGKQYSTMVPELRAIFDEEFEMPHFSVISYGKFGKVVVKAYAVLQKNEGKSARYCVKKIYWI
jgi:hypothetical protein